MRSTEGWSNACGGTKIHKEVFLFGVPSLQFLLLIEDNDHTQWGCYENKDQMCGDVCLAQKSCLKDATNCPLLHQTAM